MNLVPPVTLGAWCRLEELGSLHKSREDRARRKRPAEFRSDVSEAEYPLRNKGTWS